MSSEYILKDSFYKDRILNRSLESFSLSVNLDCDSNDHVHLTRQLIVSSLKNFASTHDGSYAYLELCCSEKHLNSVSLISQYKYLQRVDLSYNNLVSLKALSSLKHLTYLNVSHNSLHRLLDLKEVPFSLDQVDFSHNLVQEIPDLSGHRYLRILNLNNNKIKYITGLEKNMYLKELYLSNNIIQDVEHLDGLNLITLDLSSNKIHILKGLDHLSRLMVLNVSENHISKLNSVANIHSLRKLFLAGNLIKRIKEIFYLHNLNCLQVLDLCFNPIQESRYYRLQILFRLPVLSFLDGSQVDPQQIVKAGNLFGEQVQEKAKIFKQLLPEEQFIDRRVHISEFIEEDSESDEDENRANSRFSNTKQSQIERSKQSRLSK